MAQRLHLASLRLRQDNDRKEVSPEITERILARYRRMAASEPPGEQRTMLEATIAHLERMQEAA